MAEAATSMLTTADGRPLKEALATAQARARRRAFFLVVPLLAFVLLTFLIPIGYMLKRSVEHDGFAKSAPALVEWFSANSGFDYANPPEEAYAALVKDLALMQTEKLTGISGTRINYTVPGTISLFKKGAREAKNPKAPFKEALIAVDTDWASPALWRGMEAASSKYTTEFYKVGTDNKLGDNGWERGGDKDRIYLYLFFKTFLVSGIITVICLLLAFPVAYFVSFHVKPERKSLWLFLITIPFWTSYVIRVFMWNVMLGRTGVINSALVGVGVIDTPFDLSFSVEAMVVTLAHAYAPFAILPIYVALEKIDRSLLEAGQDLGETRWTTFLRVTLPLAWRGAPDSTRSFVLVVHDADAAVAGSGAAVSQALARANAVLAEIAPAAETVGETPPTAVEPVAVASVRPAQRGGFGRPAALEAPRDGAPDDLTAIRGVTPTIAAALNGLGIFHYDQLAEWDQKAVVWIENHFGFKGRVARQTHIQRQRQFAQQGQTQTFRFGGHSAVAKQMLFMAAVRANIGRHILDQPEHRRAEAFEHIERLARIEQRHILRGGDDNRPVELGFLAQGELHIARARRQVDQQHIQPPPRHLGH